MQHTTLLEDRIVAAEHALYLEACGATTQGEMKGSLDQLGFEIVDDFDYQVDVYDRETLRIITLDI